MKVGDDPYFTATDKAKSHPPRGKSLLVVRIPWCLSWLAVAFLSMQVFVSPIIYSSRLATGAYIMMGSAGALAAIGASGVLVARLVRSRGSSDLYTRRLVWSILRGLLVVFIILTMIEVA